jgi:hypothetical protein
VKNRMLLAIIAAIIMASIAHAATTTLPSGTKIKIRTGGWRRLHGNG